MDCENCPYCFWHYTMSPFEESYPIGCKLDGKCTDGNPICENMIFEEEEG